MRGLTLSFCVLLVVFLTISPLSAQTRGASGGSDAGRGAPTGVTSVSAPSSASSSGSVSYSSYSGGGSYYSSPIGNRAFASGTPSGIAVGSGYWNGSLKGTSFYTSDLFYGWNNYYSYLYSYYNLNPAYFTRFYRNSEPLITPAMLKLTLRTPLFISTEMLKMIDQLEMMYRDYSAGKTVDKEDLISKAQDIRRLAKMIRQNRTLSMIDIRKETNLYKDAEDEALSLESIGKLREMALSLNHQLTNMYDTSSSSTISVDSYKEPSFESVTKGIERACKAIENSSKRL